MARVLLAAIACCLALGACSVTPRGDWGSRRAPVERMPELPTDTGRPGQT